MKKLNQLLSLLVIIVLSYNCSQNTNNSQDGFQVIKVNQSENTSANLSDFVENYEMIKLETNDSCLIASISHAEITRDYVFVIDRNNLYQFDKSGKYIRKIGSRGRGPHEYTNIISFTCSVNNNRIYISTLGKILCFDFQGNFIEEIEKYTRFERLNVYNNQLWAFFTSYGRSDDGRFENRNIVYKYSLEGGVLKDTLLLKKIQMDDQMGVAGLIYQYLSEAYDNTYLYCPILIEEPTLRDTLYTIKRNQLIPSLKVDMSGFAASDDKSKNVYIRNINRNDKYLFVEYSYKRKTRLFIYDFSTGIQHNLTEGFNDDVFGTGNVMLRPLDVKFNQMYFIKDANELIDIVEGIDENSNPFLFIVNLK